MVKPAKAKNVAEYLFNKKLKEFADELNQSLIIAVARYYFLKEVNNSKIIRSIDSIEPSPLNKGICNLREIGYPGLTERVSDDENIINHDKDLSSPPGKKYYSRFLRDYAPDDLGNIAVAFVENFVSLFKYPSTKCM